MSKYAIMARPPIRIRRATYLKLKEIQDATGGSMADIVGRAIDLCYSNDGSTQLSFYDKHESVKEEDV